MGNPKTEDPSRIGQRRPKHLTPPPPQSGEGAVSEAFAGEGLVTRAGLAAALKVSVRTVDRMLAAGEIKPVRMRGWSVRFCLREVLEALRSGNRKWGRAADLERLKAETLRAEIRGTQRPERTQAT